MNRQKWARRTRGRRGLMTAASAVGVGVRGVAGLEEVGEEGEVALELEPKLLLERVQAGVTGKQLP